MSKANHHYVPQFYLRLFGDDKRISVFVINEGRFIRGASIKHQASHHHFYGQSDDLENRLMSLEAKMAPILQRIVVSEKLPIRDSEDFGLLMAFISLQRLRTRATAHDIDVMNDKIN